jgi:hypothetical protein
MEDAVCEYCGRPIAGLPFRCNYCGGTFCAEHHLPPNHNCPNLSSWAARPPPGVTMRYERAAIFSVDVPEGGATLPAATGWQRGWKSYGAESYSPSATPTQPAAEHGGRPRTWERGHEEASSADDLAGRRYGYTLLAISSAASVFFLTSVLLSPPAWAVPLLALLFVASLAAAMWLAHDLRGRATTVMMFSMITAALAVTGALSGSAVLLLLSLLFLAVLVAAVLMGD